MALVKTQQTILPAKILSLCLFAVMTWLTGSLTYADNDSREEQAVREFLAFRQAVQGSIDKKLQIDTPNGINTMEPVEINGLQQWLQIRSYDTDNPVLLYLHGGPGSVVMPFFYMMPEDWAQNFTVVNWDQRGTGKTRCANPDYDPRDATFEDFLEDTVDMINYLRQRFDKEKIIILGHSWGTFLGMHIAKKHPQLIHAYVGTGQVTNTWEAEKSSYAWALGEARSRGDTEAVKVLESLAPYPDMEKHGEKIGIQREYVQKYGGSLRGIDYFKLTQQSFFESPYYSVCDWMGFIKTTFMDNPHRSITMQLLDPESPIGNLELMGYDYTVPIFFFLGALDQHTSTDIASQFFHKVRAPHKKLMLFDKSAHAATFTQADEFIDALVTYVKPHALE